MTITGSAITEIQRDLLYEVFFTAPDGQLLSVTVDSSVSLEDYEHTLAQAVLASRN